MAIKINRICVSHFVRYQSYRCTLFRVYLIAHCFRVLYLLWPSNFCVSAKYEEKKERKIEERCNVKIYVRENNHILHLKEDRLVMISVNWKICHLFLRLRLKMKSLTDFENRFFEKNIFFTTSRASTCFFRDNKNRRRRNTTASQKEKEMVI